MGLETKVKERDVLIGKRLLMVENDPATREMYDLCIGIEGCKMSFAADGLKALVLLQDPDFLFDALIVDNIMPKISGQQLIAAIREGKGLLERYQKIPIIMVSGSFDGNPVGTAQEFGANWGFRKPFKPQDLTQKARELLTSRRV